jgi:RND family efflux transporter MFP subunit
MKSVHTLVGWVRRSVLVLGLLCAPSSAVWAQEFIGLTYPYKDLTLSVKVAGVVSKIHIRIGDRVQAGQTLLELDSELQNIEVTRRRLILESQAELQALEERQSILQRLYNDANKLYEDVGAISREELMKLRMELLTVQARRDQLVQDKRREGQELELAQQEKQVRMLTAPISGVITGITVDPGEWATPTESVVRLVDDTVVELRINISQAAASRLAVGKNLPVTIDDPRGAIRQSGRIIFLSTVADAASGLVEMRVHIPNSNRKIRPGVKARLSL